MISLSYVSRAEHRFNNQELTQLLDQCHRENSSKNITGLLLYNGSGTFIQVLEGPESELDELYQKIRQDERHSKVNCISRKNIAHRHFPDWKMGFRNLSSTPIVNLGGFSDFMQSDTPEDYLENNGSLVEDMLLHFKNKSQEVSL